VLIDFHTHTSASDGALSPGAVVARARERGVDMLAITDHDTVRGYLGVRDAAGEVGLRLVSGVEFSCRWSNTAVHIVGLGMDCDHPSMAEGLAVLDNARRERGEKIAGRLEQLGFTGALAGALAAAGDSQLGRPHFATWMVERGHVGDHGEAFDRYLGQGKTGDVKAFWPELSQVVGWIEDAGGAAIVAHPYKYRFTGMKLRRLLVDFVAAGGSGIEVLSGVTDTGQKKQLLRYAREFALEVSAGSDFHRDGPYSAPLGVEAPRVPDLRGVWERWAA